MTIIITEAERDLIVKALVNWDGWDSQARDSIPEDVQESVWNLAIRLRDTKVNDDIPASPKVSFEPPADDEEPF